MSNTKAREMSEAFWSFMITLLLMSSMVLDPSFAQETPMGPWVEEIVFFEEPSEEKAVDMMLKGEADIYLSNIKDPKLFEKVRASPDLNYKITYGTFYELTFNPAKFKVGLNPFVISTIREAMNYIVDRDYLSRELWQEMAKPKLVSYISAFPEYGRMADTIKMLEAKYKYDFEKGKEIVYEEMMKLGAELKGEKWYYDGKPVIIKVIARTEDQRRHLGEYFSKQLEKLSFTVERLFMSGKEAERIIFAGDPTAGAWNVYTGGWISTSISLDDSRDLGYFYTSLGYGTYMKYTRTHPLLYEIASKLWNREWKTWDERQDLMVRGTEFALKDSLRIFVVELISPWVSKANVEVAADLSGGFATKLWSRTLRYKDKVGGTVRAASVRILVDPWNPVAGMTSLYDSYVLNCIDDDAMLINPYTGVYIMNRVNNYTIEQSDSGIPVPKDSYFNWNVKKQKWEHAPEGTVAKVKVTAVFEALGKYHDGTDIVSADLMNWGLVFERADPSSPWYDESSLPGFAEWRRNFRGMRIVKLSPLTVEYYINYTNPEPSYVAAWAITWPNIPWHVLAIGMIAEKEAKLAFSEYKAIKLGIDRANYIGGVSLNILAESLDKAIQTKFIPAWLKDFFTPDQAVTRYQNLKSWYEKKRHFWVATGPYYLESVDFVTRRIVVKAWRKYPFNAEKFAFLAEPPTLKGEISVPESIVPGLEAKISIRITKNDQPYPIEKIDFVKYLLQDSEGNLVKKGFADATANVGEFEITLGPVDTEALIPGAYEITVIAVSKDITIPAMFKKHFSVIPAIGYFQHILSKSQSELNDRIDSLEMSLEELRDALDNLRRDLNVATIIAAASLIFALLSITFQFIRKPK